MIFLYHKVHPEGKTVWWVDVESFYRQMRALRGRKIVYLDAYNAADTDQVVITFDGIYTNILEFAAPILHEFGYPFELFVTSDYIGRDNSFDTVEPHALFADREALASLVALGGRLQWHSRTHVNLGPVRDREFIRKELDIPENLHCIDKLGFNWFAYPHGDFNDVVVEEVRSRFKGALSCIQGNDTNPYMFNRQIMTSETVVEPRKKVAVIIASYNYGNFLPEAVESVLRQTQQPDEVHITDDCSEDNTEEVGRYFSEKKPSWVHFHRNDKNLGIIGNFNAAVLRTRADYVCILGADNRMRSDYIERLSAILDAHPNAAIAYTDFALFGPRARLVYEQFPPERRGQIIRNHFYLITFPDFSPSAREQLEQGNFIHGSSMFRRAAYDGVGGYLKDDLPEDYSLFRRMVRARWDAVRCPLSLLEYRQHSREQANIRLSTHIEVQFYRQLVTERDGQIVALNQALSEREGQVASLNQTLSEREGQIASLNQTLSEREWQVASLNQSLSERDEQIADIVHSKSWRLTHPLRRIGLGVRTMLRKERGEKQGEAREKETPVPPATFDRNDYTEWIRRYDTLTDETRVAMRARIDVFPHKPLISVVMPTYNAKPEWLHEAIASVRKQIYPHWELCIADDASSDTAIRSILEGYANEDPRIKIVFRETRGNISAASNSALNLATGEWIALLDHDDLLAEHALFWTADAINKNPDVRLIYSDEDKIDESGRRLYPYFKCDWNVDLFYSHNLITHLGVYQAELLRNKMGGFREGLEGAQDYDLALRCIEHIESHQIYHIPRVLYHWRMHTGSTAQSSEAKPYAMLAGERALNEHLKRVGIEANAELIGFGYRVRYALPNSLPLVSLIIPTHNGFNLIRQCVESILEKTTYSNYEILIIDNRSDDPGTLTYFKSLKGDSRIRVIRDDRPFNYSALNNAAVKLARGEVVGLVNNDIVVISPDWLSEMLSHALRAGVGAVGAKLWYPNETLQHGGVILGLGGVAGHSHKHLPRHQHGYFGHENLIQSFSAVTAACLIIRKSIYEEVGGLNEADLQVAYNDVDFCLRVREAGYRNIWTPYAELYHHESATRGYEDTPEKQARFEKEVAYMEQRWGEQILSDPAYSPNLTLDHEDFSLAWPPRVEVVGAKNP